MRPPSPGAETELIWVLIIKIIIKPDMSENVKVMIRCRPFLPKEDPTPVFSISEDARQITICKPKSAADHHRQFTFDHIFSTDSTQTEIYEQSTFLLVENVLEGYNGTVFAYGQTGCGKTYTMAGGHTEESMGVTPRTFQQIMTRTGADKERRHLVQCSYIQIYNEDVYDLFEKKSSKTKLEVKEAPGKGTFIKDQKLQIVKNSQELSRLFELGSKNRAIRETSFNKRSSRSHCIFTVYIESAETLESGEEIFKAGKLNLVDLAGSERQSKLKMAGEGLKQTTRINLSLSALGNVISSLIDGRSHHIPYRDSKLTRLLQDSLGGNTKTVMIATISPCESSFEETLSTLRYASRTKFIKNKPVVNEDPKDTLLRQYAEQIRRLKSILEGIHPKLLVEGRLPQEDQEEKAKRQLEQEEKEELRKKLETLEMLLAKEEVAEDAPELQKINRLKEKLKEQQWKEQQYLMQKQKREEELLNLETNYKSLNEEVDLLRQRFQQLKTKYVQSQEQIKDLRRESEDQKQEMLTTIRTQQAEISKYRGIVEMVMTEKQVEQILGKSKLDQEEMQWNITPFLFKENTLIFPEATSRSLGELLKKEKQKMNMFVTETARKDYVNRREKSEINTRKMDRNTRQSFALSEANNRKRVGSLNVLEADPRNRPSVMVPIRERQSSKGDEKKVLASMGDRKRLNIDLGKLKMDILSELGKNRKGV